VGGAHRNVYDTVRNVERYIARTLAELKRVKIDHLLEARYQRLRSMGRNVVLDASTAGKRLRRGPVPIQAVGGRTRRSKVARVRV